MHIANYVDEIQFAVTSLFPAIWDERARVSELEVELGRLTQVVEDNYRRAQTLQMNAEDPEDVAMAVGVYWENYFEDDKKRFDKDETRKGLQDQIDAHAFSVGALSGALLQYAKQGISLAHGGLASCPSGRSIGTQSIKDVIWQSRNQSIHWEEGNFRQPVDQCFETLEHDIDAKFADYKTRNMAFDVVGLLGWKSVDEFRQDILSLA